MTTCRPSAGYPAANPGLYAFLELLRADEELIRAEFEAIVRAEWPGLPTAGSSAGRSRWGADGGSALGWSRLHAHRPAIDRHPGVEAWGRQRSPPGR